MKIKINQFETYEINYDKEVLSKADFIIYADRIDNIRKLLNRTQILEEENTYKTYPKKERKAYTRRVGLNNSWTSSREKAIYVMSVFYSGDKQLREELVKKLGRKADDIQKGFFGLKKRYNIKAEEVGLKRWLLKHESRKLEDVKIPGFVIYEVDLFKEKENGTTN